MQFIKKGIEPNGLNLPVKGEGKGGELVIEFKNGLAIVVDAKRLLIYQASLSKHGFFILTVCYECVERKWVIRCFSLCGKKNHPA
jgi:hypothetical protein